MFTFRRATYGRLTRRGIALTARYDVFLQPVIVVRQKATEVSQYKRWSLMV